MLFLSRCKLCACSTPFLLVFVLVPVFSEDNRETRMWHKTAQALKRKKQTNDLKKESIDAYRFYDSDEQRQCYMDRPRRTKRKTKPAKKDVSDGTGSKLAKAALKSPQIKLSPRKNKENIKLSKYSNRLQRLLKVAQSKRSKELKLESNRILRHTKQPTMLKNIKKKNLDWYVLIFIV